MNAKDLIGSLGENAEEVLQKAVQCQTTEGLIQLGKDNQITLSEQEAAELLSSIHPKVGELTETELDAVTGGSLDKEGETCPACGSSNVRCLSNFLGTYECLDCGKSF